MEALKVVLIVAFAVISVLLILLVLIQNDEQGGMGGLMGGAGTAAFGSHSASVVNKTTFVFVILFFAFAFSIARLNKAPAIKQEIQTQQTETVDAAAEEVNDWVEQLDNGAEIKSAEVEIK